MRAHLVLDVAYSNTGRHKLFPHRVAVTSHSTVELLGNLQDAQITEVVPQKGREQAKGGEVDVESAEAFQVFQSTVFVLEHALASLQIEWVVKPDAVAGHSLGEYAALVTAGVLKPDDALWLVAVRGPRIHDGHSVHRDRSAPHDVPDAALPPGTCGHTPAPPRYVWIPPTSPCFVLP
ncbi:hypothetical protein A0H81_05709 [Grifola frondosa]|uniref:Malonyl-CoA:ACP transacylase (MAT) domain-containing protein n=1 Tax=Grifola frondosa TaxID=5627 RepID=A0A1C7MHE4_GRIFR|nr:hypothetical protein A0H81_05709 [Grifola frondosa]